MTIVVTQTGHAFNGLEEARKHCSPEHLLVRVNRHFIFDPNGPGVIKESTTFDLVVGWLIGSQARYGVDDQVYFIDYPVRSIRHKNNAERTVLYDSTGAGLKTDDSDDDTGLTEGHRFIHSGGLVPLVVETKSFSSSVRLASPSDIAYFLQGRGGFLARTARAQQFIDKKSAEEHQKRLLAGSKKYAQLYELMINVESFPQAELKDRIVDQVKDINIAKIEAETGEAPLVVSQDNIENTRDLLQATARRVQAYLDSYFCGTFEWTLPFIMLHEDAQDFMLRRIASLTEDDISKMSSSDKRRRVGLLIAKRVEDLWASEVIATA